ncbi:MAG: hypothetical protein HZC51_09130 [Nitrospirae bacterium]|nr:hypothetical protein [Nitrospirota bacterium]
MKRIIQLLCFMLTALMSRDSHALAKPTHQAVNDFILMNTPSLGTTLNNYNLPNGLDTTINGKKISKYIVDGGASEDNPLRYANHYHNPIKSWDKSGYLNLPGQRLHAYVDTVVGWAMPTKISLSSLIQWRPISPAPFD